MGIPARPRGGGGGLGEGSQDLPAMCMVAQSGSGVSSVGLGWWPWALTVHSSDRMVTMRRNVEFCIAHYLYLQDWRI